MTRKLQSLTHWMSKDGERSGFTNTILPWNCLINFQPRALSCLVFSQILIKNLSALKVLNSLFVFHIFRFRLDQRNRLFCTMDCDLVVLHVTQCLTIVLQIYLQKKFSDSSLSTVHQQKYLNVYKRDLKNIINNYTLNFVCMVEDFNDTHTWSKKM